MSDLIENNPKEQPPSLKLVEPTDPAQEVLIGEIIGSGNEARQEIQAKGWTMTRYGDEEEPRVLDTDIAKELEFSRPRDIRKIIKRLIAQDRLPGEVHVRATVSRSLMPRGGTKEVADLEYHLTEKQALKVATQSKTTKANEVTDKLISVFVAVRQKLSNTAIQPILHSNLTNNPQDQFQALVAAVAQSLLPAMRTTLQQNHPPAPQLPTAAEIDAQTRQIEAQTKQIRAKKHHEIYEALLQDPKLSEEQKRTLQLTMLEAGARVDLTALKPNSTVGWKTTQQLAMELGVHPQDVMLAVSLGNLRTKQYYRTDIYASNGRSAYCPTHSPEAIVKIKEFLKIP